MVVPMKTNLSVNLNKVALLRNQRLSDRPNLAEAARVVVDAGAQGITVHPRPDGRHIRFPDVYELNTLISREYGEKVEFNVEGYPSTDFLNLVLEVRPTQVTLVPDAPGQRTSDHGWNLRIEAARLQPIVSNLKALGIRVSLFVDPDITIMPLVKQTGSDRIELYTEPYARAFEIGAYESELAQYSDAAEAALALGLAVNAGHDLTLGNIPAFKKAVPMLAEVSIGHAITADALRLGFPTAVREYLRAVG
jgi:pyridoxine 5-phosphate synthase